MSAFALLLAFVPYFAVSGAATSRAAKLVLALLAPTSFALALDRLLDYQAGSQGMVGTWGSSKNEEGGENKQAKNAFSCLKIVNMKHEQKKCFATCFLGVLQCLYS